MSETVQELLGKPPARKPIDWKGLFLQWKKECGVLLTLLLVLTGPFLLRPKESTAPGRYDKRLVILTPHHEQIRKEFGMAFARYWKQKTGETVYLDWRVAGTGEIQMMMRSDFTNAFERYWRVKLAQSWDEEAAAFMQTGETISPARKGFLDSDVGIGVDLMFGGGPYDFNLAARQGILVAADKKTGSGLQKISAQHPEWFDDKAIPVGLSGQIYRDEKMQWCGTCLSTFGIVYNKDVLKRLGIENEPTQWSDLADPRYFGHLALADPTKSGSVTMVFEMIVQQQMHAALERITATPGRYRNAAEIEAAAVRAGWTSGLQLIQRIAANARYFTDSSPKIPLEVSKGDAAAGMCIDFYGRTAEDYVRRADGSSRIGFVAPVGGTAVSVDGIGMLRGASQPELAAAFMEWVLSDEGQKIWCYRTGAPGGPEHQALRRLPVRKDFYTAEHETFMTDAAEKPWDKAKAFVYKPEWTGHALGALRMLIRVTCVDTHRELKKAWQASIQAGQPERALEVLGQMTTVSYDTAIKDLTGVISARNKVQEVREARRLTEAFRRQYEQAQYIAEASGRRKP
ncbi:MAG: ABC transporter substrate-binding protein [Verrucomicrobiaceae bacterium]|nr:ABC transporter substrate-binding protein [Verrucomicrobiaceae bacterium]